MKHRLLSVIVFASSAAVFGADAAFDYSEGERWVISALVAVLNVAVVGCFAASLYYQGRADALERFPNE